MFQLVMVWPTLEYGHLIPPLPTSSIACVCRDLQLWHEQPACVLPNCANFADVPLNWQQVVAYPYLKWPGPSGFQHVTSGHLVIPFRVLTGLGLE
jgi:hypothetical protein